MDGKVIGVNAALISAANETGSIGLGLAIPINDVKFAAAELREFGRVKPGWIGASLQQVTPDLAAAFGLKQIGGIIVAGFDKGSPAEAAGLQPGDLVNTFNGQSPRDVRALMRMIAEFPLDHDATMSVHRGDLLQKWLPSWCSASRISSRSRSTARRRHHSARAGSLGVFARGRRTRTTPSGKQ